jgi:hypothetical protein
MDFGYNSLILSRQPLGGDLQHNTRSRFSLAGDRLQVGSVVSTNANLRLENKENTMKTLMMTICFALVLTTLSVALPQDTMKQDDMKQDASKAAVEVTGKISDDGKTFVSDSDGKSWTIANPDTVKGHEGHHVTLKANLNSDKNEINVKSLKMAK